MAVTLVALQFNHTPGSAAPGALTIRRNRTTKVTLPEWDATRCTKPEDSPAAYTLQALSGNPLTLRGRFRVTGGPVDRCSVRAVPGAPSPQLILPPGPPPPAPQGHVLGSVSPTAVVFDPHGQSDWVTLSLDGVALSTAGVGVRDISWDWYAQGAGDARWHYVLTSRHRIYLILAPPTDPWSQTPNPDNEALPWTEALDVVCRWAEGVRDGAGAAAAVTQAVNALGPGTVVYDCAGGGVHYIISFFPRDLFNLTSFLDRLRLTAHTDWYVNCTDCAAILSTFANLLGCDWWQSRMGQNFDLNPVLVIGEAEGHPLCAPSPTFFAHHEVAWAGACLEDDVLCDACLRVNGANNPTDNSLVPLLAVNMRFGGTGNYRDRLAAPTTPPKCKPLAAQYRKRRGLA